MKLPGARTLRLSVRWLRSRFGTSALILGYHRIGLVDADPYGIQVSPRNFAEQLAVLSQRARPLRLDELVSGLSSGRLPGRAVAVTFDDGYVETLENALPVLEQFQIPATVFVASGYLGRKFWWDELAELALWPEGSAANANQGSLGSTAQVLRREYLRLLAMPAADREALLAERRISAKNATSPNDFGRCLSADELGRLAQSELISIGGHSVTHPVLASLPVEQQHWEAQQNKACLEALLERPVTAFSFPNGSAPASARAILRELGFAYACGSTPDVARPASDTLALPRFWVPDWSGERFRRWLDRWLSR